MSDEESESLWSVNVKTIAREVDVIVSCGDLRKEYLEFLLTMINAPLLYVLGNHDETGPLRNFLPPLRMGGGSLLTEGGICIEGRVYDVCGVKFFGLGGSMRYRPGKNMYTEAEMRWRYIRSMPRIILNGGIDVLVTHAPARGFGDLDDLAHRGFETFNAIMTRHRPKYMLHGHVHASYGRIKREHSHESGTRIFNVSGYRIID